MLVSWNARLEEHDEMKPSSDLCQYSYSNLVKITSPDNRSALQLRRYWWILKRYVWYASIIGPFESASRLLRSEEMFSKPMLGKKRTSSRQNGIIENLDLKSGDLVEVRSSKEIFATLDVKGKFKGLTFTPEMAKFCGKRFRVYKKLDKIIIEATGELRKLKSPTVILEGVFCDGKAHGGCDRSCFCFWREAWLRRIERADTFS